MPITILECLQNADYNLQQNLSFAQGIAREQLHNATVLLDKGYSINDDVDPLLEKWGAVEHVPEKGKEE
ncbi:MAG: hypothetical protein H8E51_07090 [Bacteroidetes bacterium]|nr:hypothetical protein [Bacteroidota bacterium]